MKKLIAIILSAVMLLSLVPAVVIAAPTADEVGKVAADYTPAGKGIASIAEATDPAGSYYLTADVTVEVTIPAFTGTLDGNGHTITVSAPLFGELSGTVKNLTVAGTVSAPATAENTGALAKVSTGALVLENVKNTANVTGVLKNESTQFATGGLVGQANGALTVTNCANTATVTGQTAGGFVGFVNGDFAATFKGCVNAGKVTNAGADSANKFVDEVYGNIYFGLGGVVGTVNGKATVAFEDCKNAGHIEAITVKVPSGGILGSFHVIDNAEKAVGMSVSFKNCENTALITGTWQTGGIGGWVKAPTTADGCKNSGKIVSTASYCGGIFGRINPDNTPLVHTIKNCENSGEISGATGDHGGILGYSTHLNLTIDNCVNKGTFSCVKGNIGGIVGNINSKASFTIKNCLNVADLTTAEGQAGCVAGIIGKITSDPDLVNKATISNCKNTGKLTANHNSSSWGGGMCGYIANGNVDVIDVVNEGDVYSKHYCAGIVGRFGGDSTKASINITNAINSGKVGAGKGDAAGILAYSVGHVKIVSCVNTGYIYNETLRAAGIYGAPLDKYDSDGDKTADAKCTNSILIDKCINFGDVKGFSRIGGISAALGIIDEKDSYVISNSVNYGNVTADVTSGNHYVSGITAYAWGGGGANGLFNVQNYGNITVTAPEGEYAGEIITAGLIAYYNTSKYNVQNCLNAGKIDVKTSGAKVTTFQLFYNKNGTGCNADYVKDNLYYGNDGLEVQKNGTQEVAATAITADVLASGKLAYDFNKAAGETILYQTIGTDTAPTAKNTSKVVLLVNGAYTNTAPVAPSPAPTGDSAFAIVLALVAVSCGAVLTMKKAR